MAFESVGGKCVFSSEWDSNSQKTYSANFGEIPFGDITKIEAPEIPNFDVLLAGFPCQPFSSIGQRAGFDHPTQGTLFFDVLRIIKHHRPKMALLENVPGLVNHDSGNTLKVIIDSLQEIGYTVNWKILDAVDFGVPQFRKRIYLVCRLVRTKTDFEWPAPSNQTATIGKFIEKDVDGYSISKKLQSNYLYKLNDGRPQVVDQTSDIQVKTLVASYHKIQRLTGTFVRGGETGLRLLTANECKAIMGFPPNFEFPVSRTQMYRQMGNSVAVPVVKAIAEKMRKHL